MTSFGRSAAAKRRDNMYTVEFIPNVHCEDAERMKQALERVLDEHMPLLTEFRWVLPDGSVRFCLLEVVIEHAKPEKEVIGFVSTFTDLSLVKKLETEKLRALELAADYQSRRAEEAELVKKQQELFIDMTCHELRNPLNGIYQNADMMHASLSRMKREVHRLNEYLRPERQHATEARLSPRIESTIRRLTNWLACEISQDIEAVETINLCARHQKRIADDVLQLSKINMNIITITNVNYDLYAEIKILMRMFELEMRMKNIDFILEFSEFFSDREKLYIKGDPIRLRQILINLLSNSIKFTENSTVRKITLNVDASLTMPVLTGHGNDAATSSASESESSTPKSEVVAASTEHDSAHEKSREDTASDQAYDMYLIFTITDSGLGMEEAQIAKLFKRFAQGTPKTYNEFGGNGLGLFITKQLIELQDGSISVRSNPSVDTEVKFFIHCAHAKPPTSPMDSTADTESGDASFELSPFDEFTSDADESPTCRISTDNEKFNVLIVEVCVCRRV